MWLVDENLPPRLHKVLGDLGIQSESVHVNGLLGTKNGALVRAATARGFTCILTRDKTFGIDASGVLKSYPDFAVVVVTLDQKPAQTFLERFKSAFGATPIVPVTGATIQWG